MFVKYKYISKMQLYQFYQRTLSRFRWMSKKNKNSPNEVGNIKSVE